MKLASYKAFNPDSTWLDKAIGIMSFGKYSHSELIFSSGHYSFSISPRDGGARVKNINFNPDHWDIVDLKLTDKEEIRILGECSKMAYYRYDYIGALFSISPFCIKKKNKGFCSQVITNLLSETNAYCHLGDGCGYSPTRLHKEVCNG